MRAILVSSLSARAGDRITRPAREGSRADVPTAHWLSRSDRLWETWAVTVRLADRLAAARRRAFVGRRAEFALFDEMLVSEDAATVLYVHGAGGVGKSTLLRQLGWRAEAVGRPVTWVDGREPDPATACAGVGSDGVLLLDEVAALRGPGEGVLEELLSGLPAGAVAVLAGREAPPPAWRTDPGWRSVLRTVRLGNLNADEGRELLGLRGVPPAAHDPALAFTHGHPLALALLADVIAQADSPRYEPATPEVLSVLLNSLIGTVPSSRHLAALEACSQVAVLSEPLLAALLGTPDARELFNWLRDLSIIDYAPRGLYPHDVAREALAHELRWRHPAAYVQIRGRARAYYERQFHAATDPATQRLVLFDFAFLHRDSPVLGPFLSHVHPGPDDGGGLTATRPSPGEWPALRAVIAGHEGAESATLAERWWTDQPNAVTVVRRPDGGPAGLVIAPALDLAAPELIAADPVAAAAWTMMRRRAPARPGETVLLVRHWLGHDTYQALSPVQTFVTLHLVRTYLSTPGLAQVFICCADPEFWTGAMQYTDFERLPGEVTLNGRRYGLFGHDWRAVPPLAWMSLLAGRETAADPLAAAPPDAPRVLDETEFAAAVRDALRDVSRPDRLRDCALGHTRLVAARAGADPDAGRRARSVQEAIRSAAQVLESSPRDRRGYRALHHTYLHPAPTQAAAAELLDLPMSTYRRHLAVGVARLTELLWQEELGLQEIATKG